MKKTIALMAALAATVLASYAAHTITVSGRDTVQVSNTTRISAIRAEVADRSSGELTLRRFSYGALTTNGYEQVVSSNGLWYAVLTNGTGAVVATNVWSDAPNLLPSNMKTHFWSGNVVTDEVASVIAYGIVRTTNTVATIAYTNGVGYAELPAPLRWLDAGDFLYIEDEADARAVIFAEQ